MCYGTKPAISIVTKLLKPVKTYLRKLGIKISIYIDDGKVVAKSKDLCWKQFQITLLVLQLSGWNIQKAKTSTEPTKQLLYLGFIADTATMRYSAPPEKLVFVSSIISSCLVSITQMQLFSARELASLLGKIQSLYKSHGNCVYMCRHTQNLLGKAVVCFGWDCILYLDAQAHVELKYLLDNLLYFNGTMIFNAPGAGKIIEHKTILSNITAVKNEEMITAPMLISDTSDKYSYIFSKGEVKLVEEFSFNITEQGFSSGHRELLGLLKALQLCPDYFQTFHNTILYWQTDFRNAAHFVIKGSRKMNTQADVSNEDQSIRTPI